MSSDREEKTEAYEVTIRAGRYEDSGVPYEWEEWRLGGYLHRHRDLPAQIRRNPDDDSVLREVYLKYGQADRDEELGPAKISYDEEGRVTLAEWYRDDKRHREGGPALVNYAPNGQPTRETFFRDGEYWTEDGPHTIVRDPETGEITKTYPETEGLVASQDFGDDPSP